VTTASIAASTDIRAALSGVIRTAWQIEVTMTLLASASGGYRRAAKAKDGLFLAHDEIGAPEKIVAIGG
jgi:hypothetical protein